MIFTYSTISKVTLTFDYIPLLHSTDLSEITIIFLLFFNHVQNISKVRAKLRLLKDYIIRRGYLKRKHVQRQIRIFVLWTVSQCSIILSMYKRSLFQVSYEYLCIGNFKALKLFTFRILPFLTNKQYCILYIIIICLNPVQEM